MAMNPPKTAINTVPDPSISVPPSTSTDGEADWDPMDLDALLVEAKAVALYVARHGDRLLVSEGGADTAEYCQLLSAIAGATATPSASTWQDLMAAYARITAVTYDKREVNGRTILDTLNAPPGGDLSKSDWITHRWTGVQRYRPVFIGLCLFGLALFCEATLSEDGANGGAADGRVEELIRNLSHLLVPALWEASARAFF